jgi:hypothetical protein
MRREISARRVAGRSATSEARRPCTRSSVSTRLRVYCSITSGMLKPRSLLKMARKKLLVCGLAPVVELGAERVAELGQEALGVELDERGDVGRPLVDEARQDLEVDAYDLVDAGLADLDDDFATIGQPRCVYLPDRGAAERRVVEPGEDSGGRHPEVFSITSVISSVGSGGTSSCIFASSVRYAGGRCRSASRASARA